MNIKTNYSVETSQTEPSQYKYHAKRNGMILRNKNGRIMRFDNVQTAEDYCRSYPDCENVAGPRGSEL